MSEFNHSGAADEEDEDDLTGGGMTKVYDDNDKSMYSKHVVTES